MQGCLMKLISSFNSLQVSIACLHAFMFLLYARPAMAESWDFRDNSAGFVVAKEAKSPDDRFEGSKLILDSQFAFIK